MTALDGHQFWADDLSGVTGGFRDTTLVRSHRDVTDAHLLALAEARGRAVVTFDTRMTRLLGNRDPGLIAIPA
jgi:predicted nucleic acid-binding protein